MRTYVGSVLDASVDLVMLYDEFASQIYSGQLKSGEQPELFPQHHPMTNALYGGTNWLTSHIKSVDEAALVNGARSEEKEKLIRRYIQAFLGEENGGMYSVLSDKQYASHALKILIALRKATADNCADTMRIELNRQLVPDVCLFLKFWGMNLPSYFGTYSEEPFMRPMSPLILETIMMVLQRRKVSV